MGYAHFSIFNPFLFYFKLLACPQLDDSCVFNVADVLRSSGPLFVYCATIEN